MTIINHSGSSFTITQGSGVTLYNTADASTGNKTLTLGGTLVSSDIVEVHYLNIVGQTVNPSANSVGSSQLTADVITGQTELASGVASTDELLISDAGVLKRVDFSHIKGGGIVAKLGFETDPPSTTSSTNTGFVDVGSDIAFTPTTSGSKVWINVFFKGSIGGGAGQYKIVRTVGGSATDVVTYDISASQTRIFNRWYEDSPSTTSEITYKLQMKSTNGNQGHTIYVEETHSVNWFLIEATS